MGDFPKVTPMFRNIFFRAVFRFGWRGSFAGEQFVWFAGDNIDGIGFPESLAELNCRETMEVSHFGIGDSFKLRDKLVGCPGNFLLFLFQESR